MVEKDYSDIEIKNIVDGLLDNHYGKLMSWEISTLERIKTEQKHIIQKERDWLVGLYDRIGEGGY